MVLWKPKPFPKFYKVLVKKGKRYYSPGSFKGCGSACSWKLRSWKGRSKNTGMRPRLCTDQGYHVTTKKGLFYWLRWSRTYDLQGDDMKLGIFEVRVGCKPTDADQYNYDLGYPSSANEKWCFRRVMLLKQVTGKKLNRLVSDIKRKYRKRHGGR